MDKQAKQQYKYKVISLHIDETDIINIFYLSLTRYKYALSIVKLTFFYFARILAFGLVIFSI